VRRLFLILVSATALALVPAVAALAASPGSVSVSPTSTPGNWTGASYLVGATASPGACPASLDPGNLLCDHVSLGVGVSGAYWDTHSGGIQVKISWADSSDNFDLYLYSGGSQVASATGSGSAFETLSLPKAAGTYEVRVVPILVSSSGYTGSVSFSSQALPAPSPTSNPTPTSSSGGGSGTGGGSGSGTGTGSSGSGSGSTGSGSTTGAAVGPTSHYASLGGSGSASGGGLFYAPYTQGGTTYFNPKAGASPTLYYASAYGGAVSGSVADEVGQEDQAKPVATTIAHTTMLFWLLLPLGLALLAVITYLVVEPEGDGERVVSIGETQARLPVPPLALAGSFIRGLVAGGRHVIGFARWIFRRRPLT
jgi:hypothetical protein